MKQLFYLNKYLWKYRFRLFTGFLFVLGANVFGLLPPRILGYAVDMVTESVMLGLVFKGFSITNSYYFNLFSMLLLIAGVSIIAMAIVKGIFMFFMRQTIIVMSRKIEYDLKNEIYNHYQLLDVAFYKRNNTGDLMSRITEDVSRVRMYLGPAIMYFINLVVLFTMVIYTMFKINAYLSFYVLLPLPLLSYSIYKVSSVVNKRSELIQAKLSGLTSFCQETFSGIRVIKSYVREEENVSAFDENCSDYKTESLGLAKIEAFFAPLMLLLIGLSTILTIYIGGNEVIKGRFTVGNITEFVYYINMLTWPVASLGWLASLVQRAAASQKRINAFLNTEPEIRNTTQLALTGINRISFNNVTFIYPDTGIKALDSVDFKIDKGEKIAIVGRTGSGKSTIAELLLRSYDVTKGEILINNRNLKEVNLEELRRLTGYVPQDVFLFSDTVTNNILFGVENASRGEMISAAQRSVVHNDILNLEDNYDTLVGERGVTLSGGQKQRISIARALIKDPELVILDDCLSAVDVNTEQQILQNFNENLKDRTVLFITHRIFSLMNFDNIIVLDNGKIVEQGRHQQLLEKRGVYYELYQLQQEEQEIIKK